MTPQRSVLIVAYAFPPTGGAGVQRMSKLAKYIGGHGYAARALTCADPSVPLVDDSLLADLPEQMEVTRVRTLEPGYEAKKRVWEANAAPGGGVKQRLIRAGGLLVRQLAFPDIQVLWLPAAWRAIRRIQRGPHPPDVVLISGPPFSPMLLAAPARRRAAVVLDYRDEWKVVRNQYEMTRSRLSRWFGDRLEAAVLRRADVITCATQEYCDALRSQFPFLEADQVVEVPNGYDPDDFEFPRPPLPTDRFVVTYAGTVSLLSSPVDLLAAVRMVHQRRPELGSLLDVQFIGRVVDSERAALDAASGVGVRQVPYLPHDRLLQTMAASHLTVCILDQMPGVERIYPGKIFELMALGRPVLTLCPDGALSRLVEQHHLGVRCRPRDVEAIAAVLIDRLERFRDQRDDAVDQPGPVGIERFDRRATAEQFARAFDAAIVRRRARG